MLHVYCRVLRTVDSIDIAILISMSFLNICTQKRQDRTDELSTCPCRSHNGLTCIRTPSIESFHPAINDRVLRTVHTPTSTQPHMYSTEYTQKLTHITKKTTPTSFLLSPTQSHHSKIPRIRILTRLFHLSTRNHTGSIFLLPYIPTRSINHDSCRLRLRPDRSYKVSIQREREDKYCTE